MRLWRYLSLASLLAVLPVPALGASFNCTQAQTPFEHAICEAPDLSRADETLAKAFATATGGLTKPSSNRMRVEQRNWLDFAQRACTDDAQLPAPSFRYDEDGASCLLDQFENRIEALEHSRMIKGHRFLIKSAYGALPDPDEIGNPDSYWKVATHDLVLPLLDEDDPLAEAFNRYVQDLAGAASETLKMSVEGDLGQLDGRSNNSTSITVKEIAGTGRISLEENSYYYPHGAAHGGSMITYHHYLTGQERGLVASDIFTGENWEQILADLAWAQLQVEHKEWLQIESVDDIAQIVIDPLRWDFSDDYGLIIQFNQYEVSAYAYGAPTITIPWERLEGITAENHTAILYGQ